jgi:carbonic anhydrase
MLSPLRASFNTLRAGITNYSAINKTTHVAAMGQRLFSQYQQQTQTPTYKVEPIPRDLIPSLGQSKQQILWLGCSDSGYEETTTLNHLLEDEMIVVRNWGNMALSTDLAWASAVQHAVEMLEVSCNYIYLFACSLLTYTSYRSSI